MATFTRYPPLGFGSSVEVLVGVALRECSRAGSREGGGAVQVLHADKGIASLPFSTPPHSTGLASAKLLRGGLLVS